MKVSRQPMETNGASEERGGCSDCITVRLKRSMVLRVEAIIVCSGVDEGDDVRVWVAEGGAPLGEGVGGAPVLDWVAVGGDETDGGGEFDREEEAVGVGDRVGEREGEGVGGAPVVDGVAVISTVGSDVADADALEVRDTVGEKLGVLEGVTCQPMI